MILIRQMICYPMCFHKIDNRIEDIVGNLLTKAVLLGSIYAVSIKEFE